MLILSSTMNKNRKKKKEICWDLALISHIHSIPVAISRRIQFSKKELRMRRKKRWMSKGRKKKGMKMKEKKRIPRFQLS
jgi:hypothetical protein